MNITSIFAGLLKLGTSDIVLTKRLLKQYQTSFKALAPEKVDTEKIVKPCSIWLISSLFRFLVECSWHDEHIQKIVQIVLDIVLPKPDTTVRFVGFANQTKTKALLNQDVSQSVQAIFQNKHQGVVREMIRQHITPKTGFLMATFIISVTDPDPAPELLPLSTLLSYIKDGKKMLAQIYIARLQNPAFKTSSVTVLRNCISSGGPGGKMENILFLEEIQVLKRVCIQDTFCKPNLFQFQSLALLLQLTIIKKDSDLDIAKVLFVWLSVVVNQKVDLTKCIPEVLTMVINLVRDQEKDISFKAMLGDLFDVTTYFCQAAGISDMNKSLIQTIKSHQLVQQLCSEAATESSAERESCLQRNQIFPEFLCQLVQAELSQLQHAGYENSASCKFINRVNQYTLENPNNPFTISFLVTLLQTANQFESQSPSNILTRFLQSVQRQSVQDLSRLLVNVLNYVFKKRDLQSVFEEYAQAFKRKKFQTIFAEATCQIFSLISQMPQPIKTNFLLISVDVIAHLSQQQVFLQECDLLKVLESIVTTFTELDHSDKFKRAFLQLWTQLALHKSLSKSSFADVLTKIASITPTFRFDQTFALWVRSAALPENMSGFCDDVFNKLDIKGALRNSQHFDILISSGNLEKGSVKTQQSKTGLKKSSSNNVQESEDIVVEESEILEVGHELTFAEKVFLAMFCKISELKIKVLKPLSASFIQQIVAVFSNEQCLNVIEKKSNEDTTAITKERLQVINTPFGKQLDFLKTHLINVHLEKQSENWSQDFTFLLGQLCQDSWSIRYIVKYILELYFMCQGLTKQVLERYRHLLDAISWQLNQQYCGFAEPVMFGGETLNIACAEDILLSSKHYIEKMLALQYISECIQGNRAYVDYMISQVISIRNENYDMISSGSAFLEYLKLLNFQLEATTNTFELSKTRQKDPKKYLTVIEQIYTQLKTQQSGFGPIKLAPVLLSDIKPFQDVSSVATFPVIKSQPNCTFETIFQETGHYLSQIKWLDNLIFLQSKDVKSKTLIDLTQKFLQPKQMDFSKQSDFDSDSAIQYVTNSQNLKSMFEVKLQEHVNKMLSFELTKIQVTLVLSQLVSTPLLHQVLMHIQACQPFLMSHVVLTLKHCVVKPQVFSKEWKKKVGKIQNKTLRSIKEYFSLPTPQQSKQVQEYQLCEEIHNQDPKLQVKTLVFLSKQNMDVKDLLPLAQVTDLQSQLELIKIQLACHRKLSFMQITQIQKMLGDHQQTSQLTQARRWVQLIQDIKYLSGGEPLINYLLNHLTYAIIGWNFSEHITENKLLTTVPTEITKEIIQSNPKLFLRLMQTSGVQTKFIEIFKDHLTQSIYKDPHEFLNISHALGLYLQNPKRDKFICAIWRSDSIYEVIQAFSLNKKLDILKSQLCIRILDQAPSKTVIFFLPQLFQSLRVDSQQQNIIADFLIRKSQEAASVAHNVLWFCRAESQITAVEQQLQHGRKVPLPMAETLPTTTADLFKVIEVMLASKEKEFFRTETGFFEKITSISGLLEPAMSKDKKKAIIKEKLIEYNQDIPECVYLPTNQTCRVVGIVTNSGAPMQSAARVPILISFQVEDYSGPDQDKILHTREVLQTIQFKIGAVQEIKSKLKAFIEAQKSRIIEEDLYDDFSDDEKLQGNEAPSIEVNKSIIGGRNTLFGLIAKVNGVQVTRTMSLKFHKNQGEIKREEQARGPIKDDDRLFLQTLYKETFKEQTQKPIESISMVQQFLQVAQEPSMSPWQMMSKGLSTSGGRSGQTRQRLGSIQDHADTKDIAQAKQLYNTNKVISCIFKVNDDLRQDILALQVISLFQKIFKSCDLDLYVMPYSCISNRTGAEKLLGGIIEVVPNSTSRDQLGKAYEINLHEYFLKRYGSESSQEFKIARLNFINSLAAYGVVSYILQIKDRHNGNILVDDLGHLIHIDFGFIYDWTPGKDTKFEAADFKLSQEYIDILGGNINHPDFKLFEHKLVQGFLAVRQHSEKFLALTELMLYSGFPCFKPQSVLNLENRFRRDLSDYDAAVHMKKIVKFAAANWRTKAYDYFQYKTNKIVF